MARPTKPEDIFQIVDKLREQIARLEITAGGQRTFGPYKAGFNVPASSTLAVNVDVDPEAIAGDDDQWIVSGDIGGNTRSVNTNTWWITWSVRKIDSNTVEFTFKNHLTTNNPIGALRFKIERFD